MEQLLNFLYVVLLIVGIVGLSVLIYVLLSVMNILKKIDIVVSRLEWLTNVQGWVGMLKGLSFFKSKQQ